MLSNVVAYQRYWEGATNFASELYFECAKSTNSNMIISSFSVANVLTLLSHAADGNAYDEIRKGLNLKKNKTVAASQFHLHHNFLRSGAGKATFSIANRIYVQQGHKLNKTLQGIAVQYFHSGIESVNFLNKEKAAETINHFVEEETHNHIKNLVKPDTFNEDSRVILINAIFFKGDWLFTFDKNFTKKRTFYNYGMKKMQTDFMYMESNLNYGYFDYLDASAIEMKYANSLFTMLMILPENRTGLPALEAKMRGYDLVNLTNHMDYEEVNVSIPKFKIEFETHLNNALKNLGMNQMFTSGLRGLLEEREPLRVSDIIHKAFIEVNEEGSVSGAATGAHIEYHILDDEKPEFNADHPFLFYILDKRTKTPVFSGRITHFS